LLTTNIIRIRQATAKDSQTIAKQQAFQNMSLHVKADNTGACKLYEKAGFEIVETFTLLDGTGHDIEMVLMKSH